MFLIFWQFLARVEGILKKLFTIINCTYLLTWIILVPTMDFHLFLVITYQKVSFVLIACQTMYELCGRFYCSKINTCEASKKIRPILKTAASPSPISTV